MSVAYYNEHDEFAAQWLRNLIAAGRIAPGDVDERSIEDVTRADLLGYTQCHFFAGIGIWSLALRRAGYGDDRRVWTGSCPCQPFSAAGKRAGVADERHLWPAFHHLIRVCDPDVVLGEQVASPDGLLWLEGVQVDMEATGYAVGAVDTCAAGFADAQGNEGFHIRQRLYWGARRLGDADNAGSQGRLVGRNSSDQRSVGSSGVVSGVGDAEGDGRVGRQDDGDGGRRECAPGQAGEVVRGLAHTDSEAGSGRGIQGQGQGPRPSTGASLERPAGLRADSGAVDWLYCRDGKYRPVESGTFPLAHEDTARVGRLRAYGNALDAAQAEGFVRAWMECAP